MALENRPPMPRIKPQALALLKGFMDAGIRGLTTKELLNFTYMEQDREGLLRTRMIGDWRARKSDLKKIGYIFQKSPIPQSDQFRYVLTGYTKDPQLHLTLSKDAA